MPKYKTGLDFEWVKKLLFESKLRPQEPPVYWGLSEQDWADLRQEPKPDAK